MLAKAPRVFVSGGSRGIGLAVALKLAREAGAQVCIAAKTATPHPKLSGTIYTAAEEIEMAGGKALPLVVDIRQADQVEAAIEQAAETFGGGLDIIINNASAISLTDSASTSVKTFDLMHQINNRGTYLVSKFAAPHLLKSAEAGRNPHILSFAPPLEGNLKAETFAPATAYTMAKMAMSLATLGFAGELKGKVGVNALWPLTYINTEAIRLIDPESQSRTRHPSIMADAAFAMLSRPGSSYTRNFEIDELLLRCSVGLKSQDLMKYSSVPLEELQEDLFIPPWVRKHIASLREADSTTSA